MKLFAPTLCALLLFASSVSAQVRRLGDDGPDPHFTLEEEERQTAKGQMGQRRKCSDTRFTMVCTWEAEKAPSKSKSRRRLGSGLDYEDEEPDAVQTAQIDLGEKGGGRRLTVKLEHVECTLGVGKKDSDDSEEDYEEYTQRLPFPDDEWTLEIREAMDSRPAIVPMPLDYYRFTRIVIFDGIEDPDNSADEITIRAVVDIVLNDRATLSGTRDLYYQTQRVTFSCAGPRGAAQVAAAAIGGTGGLSGTGGLN